MKTRRFVAAIGLSAASLLFTDTSSAHAQNAVTDWSLEAQTVITAGRPPASSEYLLALVHVAMYDAVVAIEGQYLPLGVRIRTDQQTSVDAAVAAAAYQVLRRRVPTSEPALTTRYQAYIAALPQGSPRDNGEKLGTKVGSAWVAMRAGDRFDDVVPYVQPTPGPGVFEPVVAATPVDVKLGKVKPFVIGADPRYKPAGPPALTSAAYAKAWDEVSTLGRADSTVRTAEQTAIARFWSEHAGVQWNRNLRQLAIRESLDVVESARMLAMTHVATADAAIACFASKYTHLFWRPLHAIQRADTDENPLTTADTTWTSLLTVNHPEYPSAHSCWTSAVTETLAFYFGGDERDVTLDTLPSGAVRQYARFSDIISEVGDARVFAGLHFRFSIEDGATLGRRVSQAVTKRHFLPVPAAK